MQFGIGEMNYRNLIFYSVIVTKIFDTTCSTYCHNSVFCSKHCLSNSSDTCPSDSGPYSHLPVEINAMSTSSALVVYNENNVLPMHKGERKFKFVGRDIKITQDWTALGVAAVVWDAAEVLANFIEVSEPNIVKNKSVIELGAGTGLVGMVAALMGGQVVITDRLEVINFLRSTVKQNLPEYIFQQTVVEVLDWTTDREKHTETYDVILGADIVYIEDSFEDLLKTLLKLSHRDTVIFLSCRIRYDRDTNFLQRLSEFFVIEKILYNNCMDVNLFKAIKK